MKQETILVVEDDSLDAELLSEVLKEMNYDIYWVKNGKEALNFVEDKTPSLILLDIMLPEQSGYDICRSLKNNSMTKDIPVIFISALDSEKDITKGLNLGAADYITKPIRKDLVIARVKNQLKLNEFQKEFEAIFDNIQSLIFLVDIDNGKFTYDRVNSNFENYLFMSIKDIHGRTPREIFGDEFGSGIEEHYRICYEEQSSLTYEETTILGGDKRIWLTKISPIIIEGKVKQLVGTSLDITKNKLRENKIINQKNKLEKILKTTMDGFFIVDEEGYFIDANKSFEDMIGYNKNELLNLAIYDIEAKENKAGVKKHIEKIKSKGSDRFETILKTKSEKIINAEVSVTDLGFQNNSYIFFAFVRDITERKKKQKEINIIKERLELAVEGGNIGIWDWNIESKEVYYNKDWADMIGYEEEELDYNISSWQDLVHPEDIEQVNAEVSKLLEDKVETYKIEQRIKTKEGSWKWIRDIGKVTERDNEGNPVRAVGVHIDIDKEKKAQQRIKYLSNHDNLTGLYNNRYFNEEIKRLINSRKYPISLIIGDLDNLKVVNDNYGHQIGDYYLKQTANIMKNIFRNEDVISRIGGDEFAVILPNTDENSVLKMCSRVENEFAEIKKDNQDLNLLSISLGSFTLENNSFSFGEAYRIADKRMYQNKNNKSNDL